MPNKKRRNPAFKKSTTKKAAKIKEPRETLAVKPLTKPRVFSLKRLFKNKLVLLTLVLTGISLTIYLLNDSSPKKFKIILSNFDSVAFREIYRTDNPTSPLCGCLSDSVPHDGIMIPAQYCKINLKKDSNVLSNFLFTCPSEGEIGPVPCFSFDTKIYRFREPNYQSKSLAELSTLIESEKDTLIPQTYDNHPFFSIITSKDIEVYSRQAESILTFIGSTEGSTSLKKAFDNYEGTTNKITLENVSDLADEDSINKVPAIDFHSKKIYIKWVDSLEVLTPLGSSTSIDEITESYAIEVQKKPLKESYKDILVNVAVIEPKNNIRISLLPWNTSILKNWEAQYFSQFPDGYNYMYFMNVPIIDRRDLSIVEFKNIKPFGTPNAYNRKSNINLEVASITDDIIYNTLYEKYSREEGYYYTYDSNDYQIIKLLEFTKADVDTNKAIQILNSYPDNTTDAHLLHKRSKEFLALIDKKKGKKSLKDTMNLVGRREYFRYPPLHKEKGISFYTQFSYLKLLSCDAEIQYGNAKTNISNQTLEITDMQNMEYEYPNLFVGITNTAKKVTLKGVGKIKIDNSVLTENLLENKYLLMGITITTILSFILSMLSLFGGKRDNLN